MRGDMVIVRADVVNRARLRRGLGRMRFYEVSGCDARTGARALRGGRVHIAIANRIADALDLPVHKIIDLDASLPARPTGAAIPETRPATDAKGPVSPAARRKH